MKRADKLIVIDMQNDYVDGVMAPAGAEDIKEKVLKKIKDYSVHGESPIIFTQDTHFKTTYPKTREGRTNPVEHCIKHSNGWDLIPEIEEMLPGIYHETISKHGFGSIGLAEDLFDDFMVNDLRSIEIIGIYTDICVIANALTIRTRAPEIEIFVDASCCAGTDPERHAAALEVMKSCQINIVNEN